MSQKLVMMRHLGFSQEYSLPDNCKATIEDGNTLCIYQEVPDPWTGEGLPPVGVRIEAKHKESRPNWARPGFYETEIVAIGKQLVIFEADGSGHEKVGKLADYIFRPIRTPEQIAAEQREKGIEGIRKAVSSSPNCKAHGLEWDVAGAIYDAGYRKFEIVEPEE